MIHPRFNLSLAERAELELFSDGPISQTAIQDKIRARGAALAAEVVEPVLPASAYLACIARCQAKVDFYLAEVKRYDQEIAEMQADRDGMYASHEQDRKTRHISYIIEQRDMSEDSANHLLRRIAEYQAKIGPQLSQAAE